ncbi:DUF1772 domain-containing protein [Amycolatopsis sp. GM8]|uniref:anthrone oxygenase family protein n=1 Tax=Amycolatopsis sp. GM8 TaxID=2896530 RepID=UPI001F38178C|nr:anthrone oxygenase family protein [Amycolatopsis sp. GM8]
MSEGFALGVLVAAVLAAGLIAGLFYSYSVSVMPGLARADARTYVEGMRGINVAILNGWFALSFGGAPVLALAAGLLHLPASLRPALPWIAAGFVLLLVMIIVTMTISVPLNNALDAGGTDFAAVRERFENAWVRWNNVRTFVSIAGFGCLVWALVVHARA